MKPSIRCRLERPCQSIEAMSASIVLKLLVLLLVASSLGASPISEQQQQQPQPQAQSQTQTSSQPQKAPTSVGLIGQPGAGDAASQQQEVAGPQAADSATDQQASEQSAAQQTAARSSQTGASLAPSQLSMPLRLPKINIYANKNEVKKLLGIDTRINYVTNGQLNTYPLGFTIPMGYHLSDMIFTWQNLGQTNVNYSISLVIGNIQAVERPLINITRSGLIPRHEQVFKITLPCSGKVTDEVDVQVLINIVGLVPVSQSSTLDEAYLGAASGATQSASSGQEEDEGAEQTNEQAAFDYQMARAVHQQQNELMASNLINQTGQQQLPEQMQADESGAKEAAARRAQPIMRQVSHTIAIKRKKICTMHPVPVTPVARQPEIRPPNQMPLQGEQHKWTAQSSSSSSSSSSAEQQVSSTGGQPGAPAQTIVANHNIQSHHVNANSHNHNGQNGNNLQQTRDRPFPAPPTQSATSSSSGQLNNHQWHSVASQSDQLTPLANANGAPEPPAHQPSWSAPQTLSSAAAAAAAAAAPSATAPTTTASADASASSPQAGETISSVRPQVSPARHWLSSRLASPSASSEAPNVPLSSLDNPLIELLRQQQQQQHQQAATPAGNSQQPATAGNPLLFTLVVMSLIISVALVALLVISTTSGSSMRHRHPFDKLNALTNCLLWRTRGSRAADKCKKGARSHVVSSSSLVVGPNLTIKQGAFGSFGQSQHSQAARGHHATLAALNKGAMSSLSGLSTISGQTQSHHQNHHHHHQQQQQQQNLGKQQTGLYYYAKQGQHQASHYSPYYHHYQCPPDLLIGGVNQNGYEPSGQSTTSPYHITMSNQQTTKLYLGGGGGGGANETVSGANNAGYSIDNNYTITPPTTLPHHNHNQQHQHQQPLSDSASVYQTIY